METEMKTDLETRFASTSTEDDDSTVACTAETAECTCPDFCERDHELD